MPTRGVGDDGVDAVELGGGEAVVDDGAGHRRRRARRVRRPGRPSGSAAATAAAQLVGGAALDDRAVVGDPLGEQADQRRPPAARRRGAARHVGRLRAVDVGQRARGPGRGSRRGRSPRPVAVPVGALPPGPERLARRRGQVAGAGPGGAGPGQPAGGAAAAGQRRTTDAAEHPRRRGRRPLGRPSRPASPKAYAAAFIATRLGLRRPVAAVGVDDLGAQVDQHRRDVDARPGRPRSRRRTATRRTAASRSARRRRRP